MASISTYYVWAGLLHGPDHRPGELLWHGATNVADAVSVSISRLPETVIVAATTSNGQRIDGYLPGGLA